MFHNFVKVSQNGCSNPQGSKEVCDTRGDTQPSNEGETLEVELASEDQQTEGVFCLVDEEFLLFSLRRCDD